MSAPVPLPGDTPKVRLDDLDPMATHALRLLRMWSWGAVHRETLRLAAATQFGQTQGICVVGAFEGLFALLESRVSPRLSVRQPDSPRLNADELWFLGLIAAAAAGNPGAVSHLAAGRVPAGADRRLAESVEGFARLLAGCLERKLRIDTADCPISCPMQKECGAHPTLAVVK